MFGFKTRIGTGTGLYGIKNNGSNRGVNRGNGKMTIGGVNRGVNRRRGVLLAQERTPSNLRKKVVRKYLPK